MGNDSLTSIPLPLLWTAEPLWESRNRVLLLNQLHSQIRGMRQRGGAWRVDRCGGIMIHSRAKEDAHIFQTSEIFSFLWNIFCSFVWNNGLLCTGIALPIKLSPEVTKSSLWLTGPPAFSKRCLPRPAPKFAYEPGPPKEGTQVAAEERKNKGQQGQMFLTKWSSPPQVDVPHTPAPELMRWPIQGELGKLEVGGRSQVPPRLHLSLAGCSYIQSSLLPSCSQLPPEWCF